MIGPLWSYSLDQGFRFEVYAQRPELEILTVDQVHSAQVVSSEELPSKADGIWAGQLDKRNLAIKTADCMALAFIGKKGRALIHAGHKGLAQMILTQEKIKNLLPQQVLIGPHIAQDNYQVGEDVYQNFDRPLDSSLFAPTGEGKWNFSLSQMAIKQVKQFYGDLEIVVCPLNTFSDPRLHSYRRNKTDLRIWNILRGQ